MTDTTGKILPKGCNGTGLTEDIIDSMSLGGKILAVVELVADTHTERRDGKEQIGFSILTIEPATEQIGIDHLRNFQRALYMNRKLHSEDEQLQIDTRDDLEPTVEQVVANNPGLIHHDYLETTTGDCEVCDRPLSYALHRDPIDDPFTVKDTPDANDEEQPDTNDTDEQEDDAS